jgi:hypothetical protein
LILEYYKKHFGFGMRQHLAAAELTDGQCCWNHIVGLPVKDSKEYPLFDYERTLFNSLIHTSNSRNDFQNKHMWIKKATGLGITEFMLRIMGWLCTSVENGDHLWMQTDSQMCIVTGPNIDMAIKLIRRLKNIFERKLGLIFQN